MTEDIESKLSLKKIIGSPKEDFKRVIICIAGTLEEYNTLKPSECISRFIFDAGNISTMCLIKAYAPVLTEYPLSVVLNAGIVSFSAADILTGVLTSGRSGYRFPPYLGVIKSLCKHGLSEIRRAIKTSRIKSEIKKNYHLFIRVLPSYSLYSEWVSTLGSKQLLITKTIRLHRQGFKKEAIGEKIEKLYREIHKLEDILSDTPTFGCELYVEPEQTKAFCPKYNPFEMSCLENAIMKENKTDIRLSKINEKNIYEFRINPSYAPITSALVKELFEIGILPKDTLVGYSVNIVGKDVAENALPLILVNYFTGMTPRMPNDKNAGKNELDFRDVHVYRGATVNERTGVLATEFSQLNIFAGVTAKVENNEQLKPYKEILEKDIDERYQRMLMPFLVGARARKEWKRMIYSAFALNEQQIKFLDDNLSHALSENKIWHTNQDIKIKDSPQVREKINEAYQLLEDVLLKEKPELAMELCGVRL